MPNFARSWSLKTRVVLVVVAVLLAGIWGLAARVAAVVQADLEKVLSDQLSVTVGYVAADIDGKVRLRLDILNEVAALITPDMLADPAQTQRLLERRNIPRSIFSTGLFVADKAGINIADYPRIAGRVGGSIAHRAYFREAMAGGKRVISSPIVGRFSKQTVVAIAVPVYDASGAPAGALVGSFFPSEPTLFGLLEQTRMGRTGEFLVLSAKDHLFVAATDKKRVMTPLPPKAANPLMDRRLQGFEGPGVTATSFGVEILSAGRIMKTTGWMVVAFLPTEEAFTPITTLKRQIYLAALLLSLAVAVILHFVLKRQLAPLREAGAAMQRMTEGTEAFAPLPVRRDDEIGRLVGHFNRLVAERHRSEGSLRDNASHLRVLFDSLPLAIGHADKEQRITFVNRLYRTFYGSAPEPVGLTLRESLGERSYAVAEINIRRALTGKEIQYERSFARDDGSRGTRSIRYVPDCDASGQIRGFFALIEDTTGRKQAEQALIEAEERYRSLLKASPDGIWIHSEGHLRYVNDAVAKMLGYDSAEALTGRDIYMFFPPEQRDALRERITYTMTQRLPTPATQTVMLRRDGSRIDVETTAASYLQADKSWSIAIIRDITQRKAAEAQLRLAASVYDNAAEGVMITDRNINIVSVNLAFTEITGYSAPEAIGNNPRMLNSGEQTPAFYRQMWDSLAAKGRWQGEIRDRRKNGEIYDEFISISAVRDERGEVSHYCAIFSDITARKITEAKLQRLNDELEERVARRTGELERANHELQAFSYSVSHDLRAPLRAISGFSNIVLEANEGKLDEASVKNLRRILTGAERISELIDDLLDLSRVSRQEMRMRDLDLSDLAGMVAASLAQAHPERNVEVVIAPAMRAEADPGLLQIALENLLGNAWKFTSHTAAARIEMGCEDHGGERVYFIKDNGAGFDMAYADKLFGAFQRLHSQNEFEGTGIGLSIVQRIVAKHAGRIWAEAKPGTGATFYFTLGTGARPA
jgi:PAS domain S-box-containing protein